MLGGNGKWVSAAQMESDVKWWNCKELFRFVLAMAIIVGFLIILLIGMVGKFADVPTLAGIFSAWIVAIVAFYFMEQASDRTAKIISDESGKKIDMQLAKGEESVDKLSAELADMAERASYWESKAVGFRNLLVDADPDLKTAMDQSLKREEDEGLPE